MLNAGTIGSGLMLYNILLPIDCYISSIPINVIIRGFLMVISSDL